MTATADHNASMVSLKQRLKHFERLLEPIHPRKLRMAIGNQYRKKKYSEMFNRFVKSLNEDERYDTSSINTDNSLTVQIHDVMRSLFNGHELLREVIDLRPVNYGLLNAATVGYDMGLKRIINPDDKPLVGLYGAAAVDVSRFLLSTNSSVGYFVNYDYDNKQHIKKFPGDPRNDYVSTKYKNGWNDSSRIGYFKGDRNLFIDLEYFEALLLELKAIGVDGDEIRRVDDEFRERFGVEDAITISFNWAYHGQNPRLRTIHFISGDISTPGRLPSVIPKGIDFYYEKASFEVPKRHAVLLPWVINKMKGNNLTNEEVSRGLLILDEYAIGASLTGIQMALADSLTDVRPLTNAQINKMPRNDELSFWERLTAHGFGSVRYGISLGIFDVIIAKGRSVRKREDPASHQTLPI